MDDRELLLDYVRHGSSRAFTTLVERYVDLVYSAALRRVDGDPHRATEVTQHVFTDLARKARQLTGHPVLVGWLHQSTRWAAATLRRTERRRVEHEQAAARDWEIAANSTEAPIDWDALRPWLDRALDELRDHDREAVLLRFFSKLSHADIGAKLGIGENAARMRIDRALERLRSQLHRHGIRSSGAALATALTQQAVHAAPAGLAATIAPTALAGAGTAAGSAASAALFSTMIGKLQLALVCLVAAILATALYRERTQLEEQRAALQIAQQRQDWQRRETTQLARRHAVEETALRALPTPEALPAPNPIEVERKRLDLIVRKGELDSVWAPLFRRVHLDTHSLDRLKTLLVERNQAEYDAFQVAKVDGVELTPAEQQMVRRQADTQIDAQITTLLGPDKMKVFARYDTLQDRWSAPVPRTMLYDPQRDAQVDAIVDLWSKKRPESWASMTREDFVKVERTFTAEAAEYYTPEERAEIERGAALDAVHNKMMAIVRPAAAAGKLKLAKGSAKFYPSAPVNTGAGDWR